MADTKRTAATFSQTEAISDQPTPQQQEQDILEEKKLEELLPCLGCFCCSILFTKGLPATIGCGYEGDMLCCDKE